MMKRNERREKYKQYIIQNINTIKEAKTTNEKWRRTVELCKTSAPQNFGNVKSNKQKIHDNPEIKLLSKKQKDIRQKAESTRKKMNVNNQDRNETQ